MPAETSAISTGEGTMKKTAMEKQFKRLVYEVRQKMQEYDDKLQSLELRERRVQMAQDVLRKDIEELNNLRIELATTVAGLKSERDKLLKSRIDIAKAEKNNLMSIAATYDKMESARASKILTDMSQMPKSESGGDGHSFDDAVRIVHYMTARTRAKLLAALSTSEPKLAAILCQRLKRITEQE